MPGQTTGGSSSNSEIREELRIRFPTLLAKQIQRDEWTGTIVHQTTDSSVSQNPGEVWSELRLTFDMETRKPYDTQFLMSTDDYAALLKALKQPIRDVIHTMAGQQVDTTFHDNYKERSLDVQYQIDGVIGKVTIRLSPVADRPDEKLSRVQIVITERPAN